MDRLYTSTLGALVPNVFLNTVQDLGIAQRAAQVGDLTAMAGGLESRVFQTTADLAAGTLVQLDTTVISVVDTGTSPMPLVSGAISWFDREVFGVYRGYSGANQRPGQTNDYQFDAAAPVVFWGYLGRGGKNGGGTQVAAGSPPVPASGASWAAQITTNVWLYLDPFDGTLKLYNDTGGSIRTPSLWCLFSGATGKRP